MPPVPPAAPQAPDRAPVSLDAAQAQLLLRVLAEPIRLRVVQALSGGERCVCDLTAELEIPQSKLSFHLKVMKEAGMITARQQGRWVHYRLQPRVLRSLSEWLSTLTHDCQRASPDCC